MCADVDELYQSCAEVWAGAVDSVNNGPLARKLFEIWEKEFSITKVIVHDNI